MWKIVWNSFIHIFIRLFGCMVIIHHILSIWNHTGAKIIPSELKMPKRGTLLTDFEMGKITGLHEDGKSVTEIADALGRSYNCIGNFLKRKRPYPHGGGHQEKLNERTKRQIVRPLSVRDPPSLRKLITQLKLEVSRNSKNIPPKRWFQIRKLRQSSSPHK